LKKKKKKSLDFLFSVLKRYITPEIDAFGNENILNINEMNDE